MSNVNKAFIHPKTGSLVLPEGIMLWNALFNPRKGRNGKAGKHECNFLYHKSVDLSVAKEEAMLAGKDKFSKAFREANGKWPAKIATPFKRTVDNDKLVAALEAADMKVEDYPVYIAARATDKPGIVGPNGKSDGIEQEHVYAGRKGRMTVDTFGYDVEGNSGVSYGLKNVQLLDHAEPLVIGGGKVNAESEFEAVEGAGEEGKSADALFD